MALRGIMPRLTVDGFVAELIKHNDLFDECADIGVIPLGYEVCVSCTGRNHKYSRTGKTMFVVTQFVTRAHKAMVAGDEYTPIIILSSDETLHSVEVTEAVRTTGPCVLIIFTIYNSYKHKRRTLSWIIRKAEVMSVH